MKRKIVKIGGIVAGIILLITTLNANSTCLFYAHQPKLPENALKLRKF